MARPPASYMIVRIATGEAIMETFSAAVVAALNTEKYRAVPILEYLVSVAQAAKSAAR